MKSSKLYIYTNKLTSKKYYILLVIYSLLAVGCGASLGNSAVGTTGFMVEHNRKIGLLQQAFTPSDRASVRSWEK